MSEMREAAKRLPRRPKGRRGVSDWTWRAHLRYFLWRWFGHIRTNERMRFEKRRREGAHSKAPE